MTDSQVNINKVKNLILISDIFLARQWRQHKILKQRQFRMCQLLLSSALIKDNFCHLTRQVTIHHQYHLISQPQKHIVIRCPKTCKRQTGRKCQSVQDEKWRICFIKDNKFNIKTKITCDHQTWLLHSSESWTEIHN